MKILVINILRLGDVIMSVPAIEGLKEKYPEASVDLLINDQCKLLEPMLSGIRSFHYFERKNYQRLMNSRQYPLLTAVQELQGLVKQLNHEDYDLVVNLTHNKQSAWLMGAIQSKEKRGLTLSVNQGVHLGSSWFRYLNETNPDDVNEFFHYVDIYRYGAGCDVGSEVKFKLNETNKGLREKQNLLGEDVDYICFQLLTSTNKKEFTFDKSIELLNKVTGLMPNVRLVLLGAPFEESRIDQIVEACAGNANNKVVKAICSLEGALSILSKAKLLVSCDTSIKHLANAVPCSVLELSLGTSDVRRTGIYKKNQWMIEGNSQDIGVDLVVNSIVSVFDGKAIEFVGSKQVQVFRSEQGPGYWFNRDLSSSVDQSLLRYIARSQEKLVLDAEYLSEVGSYGTEAQSIIDCLGNYLMEDGSSQILEDRIDTLEVEEKSLDNEEAQFGNWVSSGSLADSVDFKLEGFGFIEKRKDAMVPLHRLRGIEDKIKKRKRSLRTEVKLIQSIKFINMENL